MKLTKREKVLLVILIIAVIGALYYSFFLKSYLEEMSELKDNISRLNSSVMQYESKSGMLEAMESKVSELEKDVNEYVEENLAMGYDPAKILIYLQELLTGDGAEQMILELGEPVEDKFYYAVDIRVNFTAEYSNAKKIIDKIENSQYRQFISYVEFNQDGPGDEENNASVRDGSMMNVRITFTHLFDVPKDKQ